MSDLDINDYSGKFEYVSFDKHIPKGDFARFVVMFIKTLLKSFNLTNEIFPSANYNNKGYSMQKMACLVFYSYARGFTKASVIADLARNHTFFKFVANGITPDEDTINLFIDKWGSLFEYILAYTVQFAQIAGFTTFDNVSVDSTMMKAANNKFNVIHKNDAKTLLAYYQGHRVSNEQLKRLKYPARRFLNREDLSNFKKIEYLKSILRQFKKTGANTIPINDIEALHIYNKAGNPDVGYNIQTAVDYMSKMFICILVSDKATDHYQFPDTIEKAMHNMGEMPETTCVDAGFNTRRVLEYIEELGLNVLMDNNRSAKLRNGHESDNRYHKDNMIYNPDDDYFICYFQEKLIYQKTKIRWDDKKEDYIIERIYFNKDACLNCPYEGECCKTEYRKVIVSGGILELNMSLKMEDYENILKYVTRFSTVEAPNGTLKIHFHINEILSTGKRNIQNRMNICAGSYNLIRIYNLLIRMGGVNEENVLNIGKSFCDYTNDIMPIWRYNKLPFEEETLLLPHTCESYMELENLNNVEININDIQTTLIESNA